LKPKSDNQVSQTSLLMDLWGYSALKWSGSRNPQETSVFK
jgi:hypothetical protein